MSSLAYDFESDALSTPVPAAAPKKALTLEALRAQLGKLPVVRPGYLPMGVPAVDSWLGGWPVGAVSEVAGLPGSGRFALILPIVRRLARQGQRVVIVDPGQTFHPPALAGPADAGDRVCEAVLLLRPPPAQAAWAAEQVARAGVVPLVVLLDLGPLGRAGVRLAKAAEAGRSTVVVVSDRTDEDLPAALRLGTGGWAEDGGLRVQCARARDGRALGERRVHLQARAIELPVRGPMRGSDPVMGAK